jgi:ABC-type spermidine/putrescine transport system permease subunit I
LSTQAGLKGSRAFLIAPGAVVFTSLFLAPMALLLDQSFRLFVPGHVGAAENAPFTLASYTELLNWSFLQFFEETFRISFIATVVGLLFAYPTAYWIARRMSRRMQALAVGCLVTFMFLSVLVRTYALELTFGSISPVAPLIRSLGLSPNGSTYIEILLTAGLLQFVIPISALTLLGTLQNLDPRLVDAAMALGAPAWKAHLSVTLPLSAHGVLSAFLVSFTYGISAFVIPMVLGRGRVLFLSNLIYSRFGEIADYPSGAAISIVTLLVALASIFVISRLITARVRRVTGR